MKTKLFPIWKKIMWTMPHCPRCKQVLSGDNSEILPYRCLCGFWKYDFVKEKWIILKVKT